MLSPSAAKAPPPTSDPASDWLHFATLVSADPGLFAELQTAADSETFATLAARIGAERGFTFTAADACNALQAARRSWIERNLT